MVSFFLFVMMMIFLVLDKIKDQMEFMTLNNECSIVSGDIGYINQNGTKLSRVKSHKGFNQGNIFRNLLEKKQNKFYSAFIKKRGVCENRFI